jgi:hypothetical protein
VTFLRRLATSPETRRRIAELRRRIGYSLVEQVAPLPYALYANHRYRSAEDNTPAPVPPNGDWTSDEASALLDRSEQRLQSIESKGPGLATACAIIVGSIAAAISLTWSEADLGAQIILVASGAYSVLSLWAPILLVGPVRRSTVTLQTLTGASQADDAVRYIAAKKLEAAAENDRTTFVLANHQAASRNDLRNALLLFVIWAVLALTGAVDP